MRWCDWVLLDPNPPQDQLHFQIVCRAPPRQHVVLVKTQLSAVHTERKTSVCDMWEEIKQVCYFVPPCICECKCILYCASDCQMCGWTRVTDCSRRPRWFICPSYPLTQLCSWTPTSTGVCVCVCTCVCERVCACVSAEILLHVGKITWIKYANSFVPQDVLLTTSRGTPMSLPANPTSMRRLSPFPFVSISTFLFSSRSSPRGCWEFSDLFVMAVWGLQCFLH